MASPETELLKRIHVAIGARPGVRLFRNNTGQTWTGDVSRLGPSSIRIDNARPFHAGLCVGSSDLIGFSVIEITPEMVGQRVAVFTAVEIKTPKGRPTPEQSQFIKIVQEAGGVAGVARSVDEAEALLSATLNLCLPQHTTTAKK